MVAIFASASALLTPEFVESFEPEKLASKFVKVEKEYGVKFSKTSRTFNIVGHWEAVQNAHKSLMKLMFIAEKEEVLEIYKDNADKHNAINEEKPEPETEARDTETMYKIKGNPKRGRYTGDTKKPGTVPDPVVFLQYQDQAYSEQDKVNIDAVLDEFANAQINKKVTKEDLKKILEKNTRQMGRPLNKNLPEGASWSVRKAQKNSEKGEESRSNTNSMTLPLIAPQSQALSPYQGMQSTLSAFPMGVSNSFSYESEINGQGQRREQFVEQIQGRNDSEISWNNCISSVGSSDSIIGTKSDNSSNFSSSYIVTGLLPYKINGSTIETSHTDKYNSSNGINDAQLSIASDGTCNGMVDAQLSVVRDGISNDIVGARLAMAKDRNSDGMVGAQLSVTRDGTCDGMLGAQLSVARDGTIDGTVDAQISLARDGTSDGMVGAQLSLARDGTSDGMVGAQLSVDRDDVPSSVGLEMKATVSEQSRNCFKQDNHTPSNYATISQNFAQGSLSNNTGSPSEDQFQVSSASHVRQEDIERPQEGFQDMEVVQQSAGTQEEDLIGMDTGDSKSVQQIDGNQDNDFIEMTTKDNLSVLPSAGNQGQDTSGKETTESVQKIEEAETSECMRGETCGDHYSSNTSTKTKTVLECTSLKEKSSVKTRRKSKPRKCLQEDQQTGSKSTENQTDSKSTENQTDSKSTEKQTGSKSTEKQTGSKSMEQLSKKPKDGVNQEQKTGATKVKTQRSRSLKNKTAQKPKKAERYAKDPKKQKLDEGLSTAQGEAPSSVEGGGSKRDGKEVTSNGTIKGEKMDTSTDRKEAKVYQCTECDYKGCRKKRLTEHMGRVHGLLTENCRGTQEKTTFPCDLCDKTFVFGKDLNRHKKIVHHGQVHFCNVCQKSYKSKYVFDKHMTTHEAGYVQPMFSCQICDRQFTTKFSLGCHIKSEHLGLKKTFLCPTCGKSFSQIRSYRQHANVHAGIRPYVCEICGKSFTYDKSLKEHRYMHDTIRRFPCTVCGKAFRQRTCLLIHMKVHKDSKDHICSSCGKGFTQKQSLLRHERIHSGDKPYSCKLCQKSFSDYAVIRKHMLMSHKKDKVGWKDDVISEAKKTSDHYITGGPGYVPRESSTQVREKNYATVLPPKKPGGPTVIIDHGVDTKEECDTVQLLPQPTLAVSQQQLSNVSDISNAQNVTSIQSNDLSLYQPINSSLYSNSNVIALHQTLQDVSMAMTEVPITTKQDLDTALQTSGLPVHYGNLQAVQAQTFPNSSADVGLITEDTMVAAFLKAQGRQSNLGAELLTSLGSLTGISVTSVDQTQGGQGHLAYGMPSVPMTTNAMDQPAANPEVTVATSHNWAYSGYAPFYNSSNYQDYQPSQPN